MFAVESVSEFDVNSAWDLYIKQISFLGANNIK